MVGCSVLGCKSRTERQIRSITFHSFPSDPVVKLKWVAATGRIKWQPTKYTKICSVHFDVDAFIIHKKLIKLKKNTVPLKGIHVRPAPDRLTLNNCELEVEVKLEPVDPLSISDTEMNPESNDNLNGNGIKEEDFNTDSAPSEEEEVEMEILKNGAGIKEEDFLDDSAPSEEEEREIETAKQQKPLLTLPKSDPNYYPSLYVKLERTTRVCEIRRKTIKALREKLRRLQQKSTKQAKLIEALKLNIKSPIGEHT